MSTLVRPQSDIGDGDEDGELSRVEKGGELIDYVITCDGIASGCQYFMPESSGTKPPIMRRH